MVKHWLQPRLQQTKAINKRVSFNPHDEDTSMVFKIKQCAPNVRVLYVWFQERESIGMYSIIIFFRLIDALLACKRQYREFVSLWLDKRRRCYALRFSTARPATQYIDSYFSAILCVPAIIHRTNRTVLVQLFVFLCINQKNISLNDFLLN